MDIKQALTKATLLLEQKNIDSASLDAEVLLAFVLKKTKEFLYTYPETKLNYFKQIYFFYLTGKRAKNWPIAYLTGKQEFYNRTFKVNKNVLIPRPLTEELVNQALNQIKKLKTNGQLPLTIADIGTGSGNIIITIIKELEKENFDLNNFKFLAVDISQAALKTAKTNALAHKVLKYIHFYRGSLLEPLKNQKIGLILANLPYLAKEQLESEKSIKKEPKLALLGNYDDFFKQVNNLSYKPTIIYEDNNGINFLPN